MNRRKNHKILRGFKNGPALETTFEVPKSNAIKTMFSESSDNLLVHYSNGIRHCIIDDGFPYFYTIEADGSYSFAATSYSSIDFIAHEHYSSFDDVLMLFRKMNARKSPSAEKFFLDSYKHFKLQKNATFSYGYTVSNNLELLDDESTNGDHIVIYDIKSDFNLNLEFHFLGGTVVVRCKYTDSRKNKIVNRVKIYSGDFEHVCKSIFKDTEIFSCLEDSSIDFDSDLQELFRLSEIVDF